MIAGIIFLVMILFIITTYWLIIIWSVGTICNCSSALFIWIALQGYCFFFKIISFCLYSSMIIFSACPYPTLSKLITLFFSTNPFKSIFLVITTSIHSTFVILSTFSACHYCSIAIWCTIINHSSICCTSMLLLCYLSSSGGNKIYTFLITRFILLAAGSYSSRLSISMPVSAHSRWSKITMILILWIQIFYSLVHTRINWMNCLYRQWLYSTQPPAPEFVKFAQFLYVISL